MANDEFQYIKLPDGSYGKFRADATDDVIRAAVLKDFPEAFGKVDTYVGPEYLRNAKPRGLSNLRFGQPMAEFQPSTDAARQAEEANQANLSSIAKTGKELPGAATKASVLRNISGLSAVGEGVFSPQGAAIAAAQTNPFTAIPVDAALIGHGLYRFGKNISGAIGGNPNAAEESLGGLSEATGGAAGVRGAPSLRGAVSRLAFTEGELTPLAKSVFHPTQIPEQLFRRAFSPEPTPVYPGASLPSYEDFATARGTDIVKRGVQEDALARRATREAKLNAPKPELGSPENPGWMSPIPKRMPMVPATKPNPFVNAMPTNAPIGSAELPSVPRGNATPFPLVQKAGAVPEGTSIFPEPREPLPGDRPGAMWSVGREELPGAAARGTPGAVDVLRNLNRPIILTPKGGVGYPGPRTNPFSPNPPELPIGNTDPFAPSFKGGGLNAQGLEQSMRPISNARMIDSLSSEIDTMKTKLRSSGSATDEQRGALQKQIDDYQARLDEIRGLR